VSEAWKSLEPETVLPSQFFGGRASGLQPEKRLMLAVLEHAVWLLLHEARGREACAQAAEAERWVTSDAEDWPFTFLNVCQALGLDSECIRTGLRRHADARSAGEGARRHFAFRRLVVTRKRVDGRYHR